MRNSPKLAALAFTMLIMVLFSACKKEHPVGEGFEIYLTTNPYSYRYQVDYASVYFDTIALQSKPVLRYDDLLKYDTASHKLTLAISHDSLKIKGAGVYGRMFVVTMDKEPIYCGFNWSVYSSVGCAWVFIEEPYTELDHLNDNEIVISYGAGKKPDPRMDKRIIERLKADMKIY